MLEIGATQKNKSSSAYVSDTTTERFENDVLALSLKKPVIVDFWAPWCGPCRQMMPHLEKAVNDAAGSVAMVKVNIDENPELAQVFRVQSVPMVYAFFQGQPVDGFVGTKPPSELKAFIDKLKKLSGANDAGVQDAGVQGPAAVDKEAVARLMTEAEKFFRDSSFDEAIARYSMALDADPENMDAMGGIGWCLAAQKERQGVEDILGQLTEDQKKHPRVKGLLFLLQPQEKSAGTGPLDALYNKAVEDLAAFDAAAAVDAMIELTRKDREWQEQRARKLLLELFEAMGNTHPLTSAGRRKLSAVLFS